MKLLMKLLLLIVEAIVFLLWSGLVLLIGAALAITTKADEYEETQGQTPLETLKSGKAETLTAENCPAELIKSGSGHLPRAT